MTPQDIAILYKKTKGNYNTKAFSMCQQLGLHWKKMNRHAQKTGINGKPIRGWTDGVNVNTMPSS